MSDETTRDLERQIKADPDDITAVQKYAATKVRAGETVTKFYKVRNPAGQYLTGSGTYMSWAKTGKAWKSRGVLAKEVHAAACNPSPYRKELKQELTNASIVEYWTVEMSTSPVANFLKIEESNALRARKEKLMKELKDLESKEVDLNET